MELDRRQDFFYKIRNEYNSLLDIRAYELISVNISILCLYIIYVTYQNSSNKVEDIYNYFKGNPNFRNISIEGAFKLGTEKLTNIDKFYLEWINFLSGIKGDIEFVKRSSYLYRLCKYSRRSAFKSELNI